MKKIPLELYVAINNYDGARKMVGKYGINPSADARLLARQLRILIKDDANRMKDLLDIHPDADLFAVPEVKKEEIVKEKESVSNACGCQHSNACGCASGFDGYSGCSGCGGSCGCNSSAAGEEDKETDKIIRYAPLAMAGIALLIFMMK